MSAQKRPSLIVMARQLRGYKQGDKVRILRGALAGHVYTIHQSSNDWVTFKETRSREVMSKGNVEPESGFSEQELIEAGRVVEKMQKKA